MTNEELDAMRALMAERDEALRSAQVAGLPTLRTALHKVEVQRAQLEALKSRCSTLETQVFTLSERNVQLEATLDRMRRILEDWRAMPRNWHPTPLLALIEKAMGKS